ncbi:MAG TPA: hypothetical protein VIS96_09920 [Terrimicrobiaceae bacterium]
MSEETQEDWPYWKAAISCLPSQEMRDAAWEFFVRHLAQNPKMADTFSGVILVMQANGALHAEDAEARPRRDPCSAGQGSFPSS